MNHATHKLGRKKRPTHYAVGSHFLMLQDYIKELPTPPSGVDETPGARVYLGHNDAVGSCGVVGLANLLSTEAAREARQAPAFSDDAIRDLYFKYTGGADDGVVLVDWLTYVQTNGYFGEQIGQPVAIDPMRWDYVKLALFLGYGLYVGAELPIAAQRSNFWRSGKSADDKPGSWGGHCMTCTGYLDAGSYGEPNVSFDSWGQRFYATKSWWDACVDECYIVIDTARQLVPSIDYATLIADAQSLRK